MEVSSRIVIFSRGRLEQLGTPREVYEAPANEFVARFIGVMNILDAEVRGGVARAGGFAFPLAGAPDGTKARIGFRPYALAVSTDLALYAVRATLRHTYFLGILLRLEFETDDGLIVRGRMTKEEYAQLGLADDTRVSLHIRSYRVLARDDAPLSPELPATQPGPDPYAANI